MTWSSNLAIDTLTGLVPSSTSWKLNYEQRWQPSRPPQLSALPEVPPPEARGQRGIALLQPLVFRLVPSRALRRGRAGALTGAEASPARSVCPQGHGSSPEHRNAATTSAKPPAASQIMAPLKTREGKENPRRVRLHGEGREGLGGTKEEDGGRQGLGKQKSGSRGISLHLAGAGSHRAQWGRERRNPIGC